MVNGKEVRSQETEIRGQKSEVGIQEMKRLRWESSIGKIENVLVMWRNEKSMENLQMQAGKK